MFFFQGIKRLYADMHDINVDVPAAYSLLDTLANKLHSKHVLGDGLMKELPSRYLLHKCRES